jgi:hypothetical protein
VPSEYPDKPPIMKPSLVLDYTEHMGGNDCSGHFVSWYQFMRGMKKLCGEVFFWLPDVSAVNSYCHVLVTRHGIWIGNWIY